MLPNSVVPSSIWHLLWNYVCPSVICPFGDAFCWFPFVPLSFLNNLGFWSCGISQFYLGPGQCLYRTRERAKTGLDWCFCFFRNSQAQLFAVVISTSWFHWFKEHVVKGALSSFGCCFTPSIFLDVCNQCKTIKKAKMSADTLPALTELTFLSCIFLPLWEHIHLLY